MVAIDVGKQQRDRKANRQTAGKQQRGKQRRQWRETAMPTANREPATENQEGGRNRKGQE